MEFITLTTGAASITLRSEVGDDIVRAIRAALAGDGELWAGWSVKLDRHAGWATFEVLHRGVALSRCFLCLSADASAELWELAEVIAPDKVVLHRPRGVPWLAAAILPSALDIVQTRPLLLLQLADAERCVAWAVLEESGARCPAQP